MTVLDFKQHKLYPGIGNRIVQGFKGTHISQLSNPSNSPLWLLLINFFSYISCESLVD